MPVRVWRANAQEALLQLRDDVAVAEAAGGSRADARRVLRSESDLYALVVAFTDLGGCTSIMQNVGAPRAVALELARPCAPLEQAAAAFERAVRTSDAAALVRARTDADRGLPLLVRALAAVREA